MRFHFAFLTKNFYDLSLTNFLFLMRFKNKTILITGASSGIGKATAKRFLEEGAEIAITGRDKNKLKEIKEQLGKRCHFYAFDLSKVEEIEKNIPKIHQEVGNFDVLFLNAGVAGPEPTEEITEASYDRIMDTNVKGPFFIFQQALPFMKKESSVIATSSISPLLGIKYSGIYAASKAALTRLMIAFASEFLETKRIRFNIVSPGVTHTPLFDPRIKKDPNFLKKVSLSIPLKRLGEPEEIANAVLFLASEDAKYICGANLVIDGGISSIYPWSDLQDYYLKKSSQS